MTVVCVRRVVAALVLLLGSVAGVGAQSPAISLAALTPGTLVRARSTDVQVPLRGVVVAIDETTLTLAPYGGLPLKVALQSIVAMDVSLGQRRHTLKGLAVGVLAGVALGYAFPVDPQTVVSRTLRPSVRAVKPSAARRLCSVDWVPSSAP